jgi:hypothetical protein
MVIGRSLGAHAVGLVIGHEKALLFERGAAGVLVMECYQEAAGMAGR